MPDTQDLFDPGRIDSQGHHRAILAQMFAIDDQGDQIGGNRTGAELLQLGRAGLFPLPTDAAFLIP